MLCSLILIALLGSGFGTAYSTEPTPLLKYSADASWKGAVGATVRDVRDSDHDGIVIDQPVGTSTDVPDVAKAGELSFDFLGDGEGAASGSINTLQTKLLSNFDIVKAGGFTMETWFKLPAADAGGPIGSLINYAGTERIQLNVEANVLTFKISGDSHRVESAQPLTDLADNQWHHVKAAFVVTDGTLLDPVYGDIHLTVDGVTRSEYGVELSNYGDRLNRSIGIGNHPERFGEPGYDGFDDFDGLLFQPTVHLGAAAPVRWQWLIGTGLLSILGVVAWKVIRQAPQEIIDAAAPSTAAPVE